jgi:hypothetical protein
MLPDTHHPQAQNFSLFPILPDLDKIAQGMWLLATLKCGGIDTHEVKFNYLQTGDSRKPGRQVLFSSLQNSIAHG